MIIMREGRRVSTIWFIILVLLNIYIIVRHVNLKQEYDSCRESKKDKEIGGLDHPEQFDIIIKSVYNKRERESFISKNENLIELIGEKEKLIVFIPDSGCIPCLFAALSNIEGVAERIGNDRIIIVTNRRDENGKMIRSGDLGKEFVWVLIDSFNLAVDRLGEIYMFVTDRSFNIKLMFIPELNDLERRLLYYNEILVSYFTND